MTSTDVSNAQEPMETPPSLHREAIVQLEKSIEHHRQAVLFHEAGDTRQAATQATMAFDRAAQAVEISGRALLVRPLVRRRPIKSRPLSWTGRVVGVAKKVWRVSSSA